MKNKFSREKLRLYFKTISILVVVGIVISAVYAAVTINSEKELLYSRAQKQCLDFQAEISSQTRKMYDYYLNAERTLGLDGQKKTQIIVHTSNFYYYDAAQKREYKYTIDDAANKEFVNGDFIYVSFFDADKVNRDGKLYFDSFRKSMSDEQYNKICNYLNSTPESLSGFGKLDGLRYELVCTEFYSTGYELTPKAVEIVATRDINQWYVEDDVTEHFELSPTIPENATLYKHGETYRNSISTGFVLGKYKTQNIIEKLTEEEKKSGADLFDVGGLSYIFYKSFNTNMLTDEPISFYTYTLEESEPESFDETSIYYKNATAETTVEYAVEFNVLEDCFFRIAAMTCFILLLFLIVALILSALTWRTMMRKSEIESNRRAVTDMMAHDLKTPLFIISGYAENLLENIHTDKREHYAGVIVKQAGEMNELIHQMLELSRLDSPHIKLDKEVFDLSKLVGSLIAQYREILTDKKILLSHGEHTEICADKRLLIYAIENMTDNAVKYSDKGCEIKIRIESGKFTIANHCEGIEKKELRHIWEPYRRIGNVNEEKGNGLGLSIVKNIFEQHKFRYGVKYRDGIISFYFKWKSPAL